MKNRLLGDIKYLPTNSLALYLSLFQKIWNIIRSVKGLYFVQKYVCNFAATGLYGYLGNLNTNDYNYSCFVFISHIHILYLQEYNSKNLKIIELAPCETDCVGDFFSNEVDGEYHSTREYRTFSPAQFPQLVICRVTRQFLFFIPKSNILDDQTESALKVNI